MSYSQSEFAELDDISAAAYGHAVELGRFVREDIALRLALSPAEVEHAEKVLTLLRLLQPMPGDPDVLVPVGPDVATADLVSSAETQIRDLQQAVTDVRSRLMSLTPVYFEGRRLRNRLEAFDVITDQGTVQCMLDHLSTHCRLEVASVAPGGARPGPQLQAARKSSLSMRERGVDVRTIYQHTARSDLATRAYVRDVTAAGVEVRTADQVIDRILIYDRETVFLPTHEQQDEESTGGAIVVREPTLVAFVCSVFEHLWDGATPFVPDTSRAPSIADDLKQSILRLMAKGYKDEMVARRLGMSVRTCRRHISEITEELEATSRFQAGYNVAVSGMLEQRAGRETDSG
ncbi:helix-turn-helix transcriptional regulator [Streptomyces sp. HUAS TT20]|uniref:helix-turn-helix transcriptional regulator n=1 Tax=Streptomyces sp. HUAS TT20 TaxID=3447509 RepID=UPI0021DB2FE0|nr:LuxR C-terminal-related transcriptional regulator [Streptomyces sp. HUAS 15-9]UXY30510.1 LuxR C-terminal-related transcriptional regulator [Streptomyces sp. HUAS 15-9]